MRKEIKSIIVGAVLCVVGAIAIDLGAFATGLTLICLGGIGVICGPMAVNL